MFLICLGSRTLIFSISHVGSLQRTQVSGPPRRTVSRAADPAEECFGAFPRSAWRPTACQKRNQGTSVGAHGAWSAWRCGACPKRLPTPAPHRVCSPALRPQVRGGFLGQTTRKGLPETVPQVRRQMPLLSPRGLRQLASPREQFIQKAGGGDWQVAVAVVCHRGGDRQGPGDPGRQGHRMTSRSITSACDLAPEGARAAGSGGGQPGGSCSALGPSPGSTSGACSVTTARDPAPSGSGGGAAYPQPAPPFLPNSNSQGSGGHPASEGPLAPTQIESCWAPHFSCGFPRTRGMAGTLSPVSPSTPKGPSMSPSQLGQGHACWRVRARAHPTPAM